MNEGKLFIIKHIPLLSPKHITLPFSVPTDVVDSKSLTLFEEKQKHHQQHICHMSVLDPSQALSTALLPPESPLITLK